MPKQAMVESAKYQVLTAARNLAEKESEISPENALRWTRFIESLRFEQHQPGSVSVRWSAPRRGDTIIDLAEANLYSHDKAGSSQVADTEVESSAADQIQQSNRRFFANQAIRIARQAELEIGDHDHLQTLSDKARLQTRMAADAIRLSNEEGFHDDWASNEDIDAIDVVQRNTAQTAPEMRYICSQLGDMKGKTILDVGCGLGEAAVYFAMQGADVTATDISQNMLNKTTELARRYGVGLAVHKSFAETLALPDDRRFDIVYAGNLFHHVEIEDTLGKILKHLKPDGTLVSWDPLGYNPIINIYRRIATRVRTPEEHPLKLDHIRMVTDRFEKSRVRWFWLTTQIIFVIMALLQRRNPNRERFWKKVVDESERWKWIHAPLGFIDALLLRLLPFLGPLCWNVVIIATNPKEDG